MLGMRFRTTVPGTRLSPELETQADCILSTSPCSKNSLAYAMGLYETSFAAVVNVSTNDLTTSTCLNCVEI